MSYQKPEEIDSPKGRWKFGTLLCNTGDGGWSIAEGIWDGNFALGIRWNGSDWDKTAGNPQSRGKQTWFILPHELYDVLSAKAKQIDGDLDVLECTIKRPESFEEGAFSVNVKLCNTAWDKLRDKQITFSPPRLKHWLWVPIVDKDGGKDYNAVVLEQGQLERAGKVIDGEWKSLLYSSGISLKDNPISLEQVEKALVERIKSVINAMLQ